jgi:beta-ureidopropionase / N-carbamoyl-L-amino-acid hydrolase
MIRKKAIESLRVDGNRLWQRIMKMAEIGKTQKGGSNRIALSDEDKAGRDLFINWCEKAGCTILIDEIGNIFARRSGREDRLKPIIVGSHLDTQPTGGKYDGVYGVLAGLELIETLNQYKIETVAPIEVVVWTNEEGARFSPAMIGSGVFTGVFNLEESLKITDKNGIHIEDELHRISYKGTVPAKLKPILAAFEVHIEQGPILETEKKQIGVLTGVQGINWYDVTIEGKEAHAGPTPMNHRQDPFTAALPIMQRCYQLANEHTLEGRVTFGDIKISPGSRNTVPGTLVLSVDLRHPDEKTLNKMHKELYQIVDQECKTNGLSGSVNHLWHMPVTVFDPNCIEAVRKSVRKLGYSHMEMVSGAGHDSVNLAKVVPTAMIFVPCKDGLSHNEMETVKPDDLTKGCNVLLHAVLEIMQYREILNLD